MARAGKLKVAKREAIRLLVTGGREYDDEVFVARILKRYKKKAEAQGKVLVVIQGGARGLDSLAREWCKKNGVPCITMDAHWEYYHSAAGPIRNGWMIEFCFPTHCYVFPGGKGTNDMKEKADNLIVASYEDEE
jgi:YspA, cpYpsA-related SLOG family